MQITLENREKFFDLFKQITATDEILHTATDETHDPEVGAHQYGLAILKEGDIEVAGFTGELNSEWAGDNQDQGVAVSVQGNTLESEAVVLEALDASRSLMVLPD